MPISHFSLDRSAGTVVIFEARVRARLGTRGRVRVRARVRTRVWARVREHEAMARGMHWH